MPPSDPALAAVNRAAALVRRQVLDGPYVLLTFDHPEVARRARAGQFVMIKAGTSAEPPLRRPFSILGVDPAAGAVALFPTTIRPGTRAPAPLAPGEGAPAPGPPR